MSKHLTPCGDQVTIYKESLIRERLNMYQWGIALCVKRKRKKIVLEMLNSFPINLLYISTCDSIVG
jgi:hypothetical protein